MNWYLAALKKYAQFTGRARRKEYWMFMLFYVIFAIVAMLLDNLLGLTFDILPYGFIYLAYALAMLLPNLAVAVRRLHDVGKSGWMVFISIIPLIGSIWLLVLLVSDSETGPNQYGPNPKHENELGSDTLDGDLAL